MSAGLLLVPLALVGLLLGLLVAVWSRILRGDGRSRAYLWAERVPPFRTCGSSPPCAGCR